MHKITLIPGDGIGPEVAAAMKTVVDSTGIDIEWDLVETTDPNKLIEAIKKNKIAIKGPITTPVGKGFRSINVKLRQELNLYANLRPVKSFKGIESRYEDIDIVIVRENTEDLYAGIEHKLGDYGAESIKIITKDASQRIAKFAFDYAKDNKRDKVTAVHKANIMKLTDGLFLNVFRDVAANYDIEADDIIVDAASMNLVLKPENYDVMVMPNLYGDILSDLCAGLVGGIGIVPGANIGEDYAVFEAVHGSALEIAGKNMANPTALIQSAVMMLRYIGEYKKAEIIENTLKKVFLEGKILTADLGGNATTAEFTDEVCRLIRA